MIKRPLQLSHDFLAEVLDNQAIAVDATMGNGHDTVFLAKYAKEVYAFDVQEQALERTKQRLKQNNIHNVHLILDGHQKISRYVDKPIRVAIFNLGYLPNSDKIVITKPSTTLVAISEILERLEVGGRLAIMIYYGHDGGEKEKKAVLDFVSQLEQTYFSVMLYQALNQLNCPPFLVMIEKLHNNKEG